MKTSRSARILIADDHEVVRKGLRALIEAAGHEICAEAATGREAVALAQKTAPHVAVLDLSMPDLNGLEAARQIRAACPDTQVLAVSAHESEQLVHDVLAAGARGYILKSDAAREMVAAIEALLEGRPHFTSRIAEIVLSGYLEVGSSTDTPSAGSRSPVDAAPNRLTPREREILQLVAEGKGTKQIAALLGISVKTVETHRSNLMRTLGLDSVPDLVRYAVRNRIIEP